MSERFEHHHDLSTPPTAVRWDLGDRPVVEPPREKICAVRVGLRVLGIAERFVRGLRQIESLTDVPLIGAHVLGVTAIDGEILPLVEIAEKLGERPVVGPPYPALLVEAGDSRVLIAIDEVVAFEKKSEQEGDTAKADTAEEDALPWTTGTTPIQGRPILLLDLPGLLQELRPTTPEQKPTEHTLRQSTPPRSP